MSQQKSLARAIAIVLSALMCCPVTAADHSAANMQAPPRTALDLQMSANGSIRGKVVNRQGKPVANAKVQLVSKRGDITELNAGTNGDFATTGCSAGEYKIRVENQSQIIRVWTSANAPPNAAEAGLFVVGTTVRGQCGGTACEGTACDAWCDSCSGVTSPASSCGSCCACSSCDGHGTSAKRFLTNPWVIGAGVAAAIAIPLALDDDDDAS